MENQTMKDKQYEMLCMINFWIGQMSKEDDNFKNMVNDSDIFGLDLEDFEGEIERRFEIFKHIKDFYSSNQKICATIGISNSFGVSIVEAESDFVFGYAEYSDGKEFFLSEVEYKIDEDAEEDEESNPVFTIGEDGMELNLNLAMRV